MKTYKLLLSCLIAVLFTACIQIEEEVEIKENGSGYMSVQTDMGQLFELLKGFASEEDLSKEDLEKVMDTTIMMKEMLDTVKDLTADKKALLQDAKMNLKMNMKENLFRINLNFPFKNLTDANKLSQTMNEINMLNNSLKNLGNQQASPDQPANIPGAGAGGGLEKITSIYDIKFSNGEYSRVLNKARYDSLANDPKLQESKGMLSMMGDMSMNLKVKLPRKAKSVSNPKAVLSDDKKTVTLKGDLVSALDSPQNLEIIIRY